MLSGGKAVAGPGHSRYALGVRSIGVHAAAHAGIFGPRLALSRRSSGPTRAESDAKLRRSCLTLQSDAVERNCSIGLPDTISESKMTTKALTLTTLVCVLASCVFFQVWTFSAFAGTFLGRASSGLWLLSFLVALITIFALGTSVIFRTEKETPGRMLGLFVLIIVEGFVANIVMVGANFIGQ